MIHLPVMSFRVISGGAAIVGGLVLCVVVRLGAFKLCGVVDSLG